MYCKNCGKVLLDGDKFCSGCGTKVETENRDRVEADFIPDFQRTEKKVPSEEQERPRPRFHLDEFSWDLNGYPTDNKKTDDIDFNWASVMDEKKKKIHESRVPLFREPAVAIQKPAEETPVVSEPEAEPEETLNEEELFADMGALKADESTKVVERTDTGRAEKVDKFYTFNKKNEELQALLEQEYERIKNGGRFDDEEEEPEEIAEKEPERIEFDWNAPVEDEPEIQEFKEEVPVEIPQAEETSYICTVWAQPPAGVLAPELYEEADAIVEAAEAKVQTAEEPAAEEPMAEEPVEIKEPEEEKAPVEEQCPPSEEDTQKEKTKLAFDDVFGDDDDDADGEEKKGKGLKVLAVILCLLVIAELCIIGIQYFAPDSAPGKMINNGYKYILTMISGEDKNAAAEETTPAEEASGMEALIEKHMDENKNVAAIEADDKLLYEDGEDYGFLADFKGSYNFTDKAWYTGDDGESVSYGDEIVKALIGYYSSWVDKANGQNDDVLKYIDNTTEFYIEIEGLTAEDGVEYGINRLGIGEIRAGGSGFYVLTSVTKVNSADDKDVTNKEIVYMEPYEKTMKIIVVKKI